MRARLMEDDVLVYHNIEGTSPAFLRLPAGLELEVTKVIKRKNGVWAAIRLPDKQTGFMSGNAQVYYIRRMRLADKDTPVYADPAYLVQRDTLKRGAVFTCLDTLTTGESQWLRIVDSYGREGFIPGSTKVTMVDPAVPLDETVPGSLALKTMVNGALWAIGGTIITVWSINAASEKGGMYIVTWGAIIFGIGQFFKGIGLLVKGYR